MIPPHPQAPALNFYPRPPRGGRRAVNALLSPFKPISIHALREEGDWRAQSTASRPRISIHALREEGDGSPGWLVLRQLISIHALREEGDNLPAVFKAFSKDFYPRPPRGGRPCKTRRKNRPV